MSSLPSTQNMMLACIFEKINSLEQQIQRMSPAPGSSVEGQRGTETPLPTRSPVPKQMITGSSSIPTEEETSRIMGIGNSERVAILARVSTSEQRSSTRESLTNQVEACMEQLHKMGGKNPHLISQLDESASGEGKQQDEFFANVANFKKKPVVMVRTVSRFSRNVNIGFKRLNDIHQAGGRLIFGVPREGTIVWYDSSTSFGISIFKTQLEFAEQWTQEMSATAKDNAKRKRNITKEIDPETSDRSNRSKRTTTPELTRVQVRQQQAHIINQVLHKNNRDSFELRRIIDWIHVARRGGTALDVLNRLKDLVDWNKWKHHVNYHDWRTNHWVFTSTQDPQFAQPLELTFEWIALNLKEWKIQIPPIRGIANIRAGWTADLVELMFEVDGTNELQTLVSNHTLH
jgi:DNA invertase Pin-like site-specific DNA recombinase